MRLHTADKRKLLITGCSLLLCCTLLVSASFAWITLSKAPEITGIETTVGANGSLEIALLSELTYTDPTLIHTSVGDSQVTQETVKSNLSWGNVVDLSDTQYGLSQISMLPSRLNVADNGTAGGMVKSNVLSTVEYGLDGRAGKVNLEMVSAAYSEDGFYYDVEKQAHGVLGIGTLSMLSPQQSALNNAKSLVGAYTSAAAEITKTVWTANGGDLLDIFLRRYLWSSNQFTTADVAVVRDALVKTQTAYGYFDAALRQGMIGVAASEIVDAETFCMLRDSAENTAIPLTMLLSMLPTTLPSGFTQQIRDMDEGRMALKAAIRTCDLLKGENISWELLSPVIDVLIDGNNAYLGDYRLASAEAYAKLEDGVVLTLKPGAGRLAEAADYCGNYSTVFMYSDLFTIDMTTVSNIDTPYLQQVSKILEQCVSAVAVNAPVSAKLEDTYGFAIDLAFRSNADTQLLLQTEAIARIDGEENMGNGSCMCLMSEQLEEVQIVKMMDAMRIGFLDNQNNLLAVAKMNTSNYTVTEAGVTAPLYLYDYEIGSGNTLALGERRDEDTVIAELTDSTIFTVTAIVWLDGDYVDNSMATIRGRSVQGSLNLQFASGVPLKPAHLTIEQTEELQTTAEEEKG